MRVVADLTLDMKERLKQVNRKVSGGSNRCSPCAQLLPQDQVAKLALEGIKPAMMYCGFQQWAVAKQEIPGEMDLKRARELQVLEIVETAGSFVRVQHPRTRQLLGYISGNKYASINRAEFGKILASLYQECKDTGLQLARAGPGTLSFDGQFSQGHCMVNLVDCTLEQRTSRIQSKMLGQLCIGSCGTSWS